MRTMLDAELQKNLEDVIRIRMPNIRRVFLALLGPQRQTSM